MSTSNAASKSSEKTVSTSNAVFKSASSGKKPTKRRKIANELEKARNEEVVDVAATRDFILGCLNAGAEKVAVHMRMPHERPRHNAHWKEFGELLQMLERGESYLIANGDFLSDFQIRWFTSTYPGIPLMIARGAQRNPGIFRHFGLSQMSQRSEKQHVIVVADVSTESVSSPGNIDNTNEANDRNYENNYIPATPCTVSCAAKVCTAKNPDDELLQHIVEYAQASINCGAVLAEIKWNLLEMLKHAATVGSEKRTSAREWEKKIGECRTISDLVDLINGAEDSMKVRYCPDEHPVGAHSEQYMSKVLYEHFVSFEKSDLSCSH